MLYLETEAVELKKCLTDSFEKEVVAFLNSRDGKIYIGIDNEGEIIGVSNPDEILRKISDIISNNILPTTATLPAPSAFSTVKLVRIVVSLSDAVKVKTPPSRSNNTHSKICKLFFAAITRLTACNCANNFELDTLNFIFFQF